MPLSCGTFTIEAPSPAITRPGAPRHHEARRPQALGHRPVAAGGNRLRAPAHALAALEDPAHELRGLQLLEHVVAGEGGVAVVEADHEPDRDLVLAHRVDEAAAELAVLGLRPQRPAH